EALNDAEASGDPEEITAARRNLTRAELDLESQTWRLQDATAAYNEVANWSADTDEKVKNARDKVTQAERRLEAATADSAKRMGELQDANQKAAEVAAASPSSFAQAERGVSGIRDRANEAKDAFLGLASGIERAISNIVGMNITAAQKAGEIDKIVEQIMANPFLDDAQRGQLLRFAWASKAAVINRDNFSSPGGIETVFDDGGVANWTRGEHRLAWVAGGETVLPTHKRPMESITATPAGMAMAAAVGAGGRG